MPLLGHLNAGGQLIVSHSLQEHLADGSQGDVVYKALLERAAAEPVRCSFKCSLKCSQLAQGEALQGTQLSLFPLAAVLPWWRSVLPSSSCSCPGKRRWLGLPPSSVPAAFHAGVLLAQQPAHQTVWCPAGSGPAQPSWPASMPSVLRPVWAWARPLRVSAADHLDAVA